MTDLDLDAIRARLEAATPGPWEAYDANDGEWPPRPLWSVANDAYHNPPADEDAPWIAVNVETGIREDAEFIAHARADIPALLAEVERLRREQSVELANAEARADVLAEQVARLEANQRDDQWVPWQQHADLQADLATTREQLSAALEAFDDMQALAGRLKANQLPDGGQWRTEYGHRSGLGQQMGDWTPHMPPDEEGRSYCIANGCEARRVWTGRAEPIGPVSDSEPRSDVDPADDTQTPHTAV